MGFRIYVVEDFDGVSRASSDILLPVMKERTILQGRGFNLGLATGSSPTGLYLVMSSRAGQQMFEAEKVRSWNLDEYVGLPGSTPEEREAHPESYHAFMRDKLFKHLNPGFSETHIPKATDINQSELETALNDSPNDYTVEGYEGESLGKAIVIKEDAKNKYLRLVKEKYLDGYIQSIANNKIHWWILGIGQNSHIGFHERGIPLHHEILLVKLDRNTVENAVRDGHFPSYDDAPKYAISVGAGGISAYTSNILLLASGERKTEAVTKAVVDKVSRDVPASILQHHAQKKGRASIMVLDEIAAGELLSKTSYRWVMKEKVIEFYDIMKQQILAAQLFSP